ncbi:hypothetical protein E8E11_006026 [Didymella keratinophila]|nr:hypothetical protein E8E11_006026 [Didymella keratinophila]
MALEDLTPSTPADGKVPMRVLVLGLPRTNTTSLTSALRTLGYNPYTMRHLATNPSHIQAWHSAVSSTAQTTDLPLPIKDILSSHDAIADLPGCMFAPQLIAAYPDARVILTTRRYEAWQKSMQDSIWVLLTWRLFTVCRLTGLTELAPLIKLLHALFSKHNGCQFNSPETREAYERHNEVVREMVPRERLLEIDAEDDVGWREVCGFLGVEQPQDRAYPRLKEDMAMRKGLEQTWLKMLEYVVMMAVLLGLVVVGFVALYVYADELRGARDAYVLRPLKEYLDTKK